MTVDKQAPKPSTIRIGRRRARVRADGDGDECAGYKLIQRISHRADHVAAVQLQLDRADIHV